MTTLLIVLFVITYLAIALEHMLHINKSASALLGQGYCGPFMLSLLQIRLWSARSSVIP